MNSELSLGQEEVSPLWEEGSALNVSSVWPISKQPTSRYSVHVVLVL